MRPTPINDTVTRNARIRADGRVVRGMRLARVRRPEDSEYPWADLEIVRRVAPDEAVWRSPRAGAPR